MNNIKYKDVLAYLVGNFRYTFYETVLERVVMFDHIREQITHRIRMMKPECYNTGACVLCGCTTTALQMANKACEGSCYPTMFSRKEWKLLKEGWIAWKDGERWTIKDRILTKIK